MDLDDDVLFESERLLAETLSLMGETSDVLDRHVEFETPGFEDGDHYACVLKTPHEEPVSKPNQSCETGSSCGVFRTQA